MNVTVFKSTGHKKITVPGSKSYGHRILLAAFICSDKVKIKNIYLNDDIKTTLNCLKALGADININNGDVSVSSDIKNLKDGALLDCFESGSTLRFLIPIAFLSGKKLIFTGTQRLFERPLSIYELICKKDNILFKKEKNALEVSGKIKGGEYKIPGNISSQFITGLLYILPLLETDSKIIFTTQIESRSYIDITINVLKTFGIDIDFKDNFIFIKGNQKFKSLKEEYIVPIDQSSAAFFGGFNAVGNNFIIENPETNSLQGDSVWQKYFEKLKEGCPVLSVKNCPDLAPVLTAVAAALNGAKLTDTKRLKLKESDRAEVMKEELLKFGIKIENKENEIIIPNKKLSKPKEDIFGHNDHRIVMALTILLSLTGGKIVGAQAINKSFPDFFDIIESAGIKLIKEDL